MEPPADVVPAFVALARHIPIVVLTPAGAVVAVTEAAERLLAVRAVTLIGRAWTDLCADPSAHVEEYLAQCARTLAPIPGAFRRELGGTSVRFRCEGYAAALPGEPTRAVLLQIRRQDKQDSFIMLGQKIAELNAEILRRKESERRLAEARAETENASRAKDEFLAMLGHELRNPLAPILTALQLMQLRGIGAEKERSIIERQVKHMVRLVDDLLDISRFVSGKIDLKRERIELGAAVAQAIEMASPLLEKRQHHLVLEVAARDLVVEADAARLAQVVSNLITNAAKYSEPGASIWISAKREQHEIVLRVRDAGIGIEAEMLARIFDRFVQEKQALDRSQGGLGLGLAIVRSLVELHGGTVAATSAGGGHGAEFVVRLPAAAAPRARASEEVIREDSPSLRPGGYRVLVVDDNEDGAELLSETLIAMGHTTRVAHDGPGALRAVKGFTPQLALLDIGLPVMDGYELAERLRQEPGLRDLKIVAVTGYGQDNDLTRSRKGGFDGHLVKPVRIEDLRSIVRDL